MAVQDLERIEGKIDRVAAGAITIADQSGNALLKNMAEVMEFAKLMSVSGTAVPKHLRTNPGACLAICVQALEWNFSPFAVANQSYEVNDRIAYQSMLIHAVIEARVKLKGRLRPIYEGDGPALRCIIRGHPVSELEPLEYKSPTVGSIKVKNSPLWTSDVEQQLFYYSSRAWARRYFPDVLLGVYSKDELEDSEIGADNARNITPEKEKPNIGERLKGGPGKNKAGFQSGNVDRALEHKPAEPAPGPTARVETVTVKVDAPVQAPEQRQAEPIAQTATADAPTDSSPPQDQSAPAAQPDAPTVTIETKTLSADESETLKKALDLAAKGGARELRKKLARLSPEEATAAEPWLDALKRQATESDAAVGALL